MSIAARISGCRICGNTELQPILDLGVQFLTGVFPEAGESSVSKGPLELVRCTGGAEACGLVQLNHSYDSSELYGDSYGYRSGLNRSMVEHLRRKVEWLSTVAKPAEGDVVIDIGSNDGTTLSFFSSKLKRVGVDPTAAKFSSYYQEGIELIPDFFSKSAIDTALGGTKANVITSIAMFYDLAEPQQFVNEVASVLSDEGVWHFEQSYLPMMLDMNAYDTVCHEHLEYYALSQVRRLLSGAGLEILDVQTNDVNGGSFAVTACKPSRRGSRADRDVALLEAAEDRMGLSTDLPYREFRNRVVRHREQLRDTTGEFRENGKKVFGYGASTKGNVILQYCGFTRADIPCIAEVNSDKFGKVTPGTGIPIVSETEARQQQPDVFLVLPWHFKSSIVERESAFLDSGGELLFPLPSIHTVSRTRE